jgi:hypothetical protein
MFVGVRLFGVSMQCHLKTPSRNSSESMPCGGGDIGMIMVEDGAVMFYVSRTAHSTKQLPV